MSKSRKTYNQETQPMELEGRMQPQAVDLEEAVLGSILLENNAFEQISDIFFPDMFYKESNQNVARAVLNLKNDGKPVDILTVTQELKRIGLLEITGGPYYVSKLTDRIASAANIEFHARIVLQCAIKREMILQSTKLIKSAYDDSTDVIELVDDYEKGITKFTSQIFTAKSHTSSDLFHKIIEENKAKRINPNKVQGVETGFRELDALTNGWQKSDLIILAARPGMGKTAFVLCTARHAVKKGSPVAIFSMEMSALQLYNRLAAQETEIPHDIIKKGMDEATEKLFKRDMDMLVNAPLYIDDQGGLSLFELRNKARKLKRDKKIEMIIIDYLQLMSGNGKEGNREQEISIISRGLKALGKELDIPIIALSQLSRSVENRPGGAKIPQLSDLRDSGSIEQDADMVFFLYRPEYYGISYDADNEPTAGKAKLITAKNRHGALTDVDLRWIGYLTKFTNYGDSAESGSLPNNNDFLNKDEPF
jgi:replicative DNA helicase